MKKISLLVLLLVSSAILSGQNIERTAGRLYKHVSYLTSITPARNHNNPGSLNMAAQYIINEFRNYGYTPHKQEFRVNGKIYKNIIATYGEPGAQRIIIGAHYDVCGSQPGADDNASGIAGLLELSRLVVRNKPELKYRIDFVAYSLEEPPFFRTEQMGSAVHAKSLYENKVDVKVMIVLEMIGYYTEKKKSQRYPIGLLKAFYPTTGNFIAVVGRFKDARYIRRIKKSMRSNASIKVESISAPAIVPGIDFSDHRNYWKYGYHAVMITDTAFYRNGNYHERSDTINTLDFKKMSKVVKGVYFSLFKV